MNLTPQHLSGYGEVKMLKLEALDLGYNDVAAVLNIEVDNFSDDAQVLIEFLSVVLTQTDNVFFRTLHINLRSNYLTVKLCDTK